MRKFLLSAALSIGISIYAQAQIGVSSIGQSDIGISTVGKTQIIGQSSTPRCLPGNATCSPPAYIFIGSGNWLVASNWQDGAIPPQILPSGNTIIIDAQLGGECQLTIPQTINAGASFIIVPQKRLRVTGTLTFLK